MRYSVFLVLIVLLAVFASTQARNGGQTSFAASSSSKSRAGLGVSSSKNRAGLGLVRKSKSRPVAPKPKKVTPKKSSPKPFPFGAFLDKHAGHFTQPTRACLYSCKSSKLTLFNCARACFASACMRRIPKLAVKCAQTCGKVFGRVRCNGICQKVTSRLQTKCRRFK